MRTCYRLLLWLHPPVFRRQFGDEMLWIFDQATAPQGTAALFFDGAGSLARQWVLRSGWWRMALALALATVQVVVGGLATLIFGHNHIVLPAQDRPAIDVAELARHGAIAHQPLSVGMLMYLAVFIIGGLAILVVGLTLWTKGFRARPRRAGSRVR